MPVGFAPAPQQGPAPAAGPQGIPMGGMQQGQPSAPVNAPKLNFQISNGQQDSTVDDQFVMNQLAEGGYNPLSISPDGSKVTLADEQGEYEMSTREAIGAMGWEVSGIIPVNATYGGERGELRAAISKLPDDQSIRSFLSQSLQNQGMEGAAIEGYGRDWFVFSPGKGEWISITNNPDWDSTDAVEAVMEVPRIAGSIAGGAIGAATGLGTAGASSVPGFLMGTAAGGAAGDALGRGALSIFNPEYRSVAEENIGGIVQDIAIGSAVDTATAGALRGAGPAVGKFINKGLGRAVQGATDRGVVSQGLQGAGQVAETVGGATGWTAGAVNTPVGRSVVGAIIPGVGEAELGGAALQGAGLLTRNIPGLMSKAGRSQTMQKYAPKAGDWLEGQSHRFRTVRPQQPAADVAQQGYGIPRQSSFDAYTPTSKSVAQSLAVGRSPAQQSAASNIGGAMDKADVLGQNIQDAAQGVTKAGLNTVQAGGYGVQKLGQGAKAVGRATGPVESRVAARYGTAPYLENMAEESIGSMGGEASDFDAYLQNELEQLRLRRSRSNIDSNSTGY